MVDFGEFLKKYREENHISQKELGLRCQKEQKILWAYENHSFYPNWKNFTDIIDSLGYDILIVKKHEKTTVDESQ